MIPDYKLTRDELLERRRQERKPVPIAWSWWITAAAMGALAALAWKHPEIFRRVDWSTALEALLDLAHQFALMWAESGGGEDVLAQRDVDLEIAFDAFTEFVNTTVPAFLDDPSLLMNEAVSSTLVA